MRKLVSCIALTISSVLFSVAVTASPIDTSSFDVTISQSLTTLPEESTEMTQADFVGVMLYVVDLDVDSHIPITDVFEVTAFVVTSESMVNKFAVVKNINFERMC